jgi:hypothetical protein
MGATNCNSCSQGGLYFGFGKTSSNPKLYTLIKGKQRRIYVDSKGRYYKEQSKKKYLKKGIRTYKLSPSKKIKKQVKKPIKKSPIRKVKKGPKKGPKKVPKGYYLKKKVKSPFRKVVKNKKDKPIGDRLSARAVFNDMGMKAIGMSFLILQKDGTRKRKILRLRKNGSPYFANNFGNNGLNSANIHDSSNSSLQLNISTNKNWLRGPEFDNMTGLKKSWPTFGYDIAPGGVAKPFRTSLLPSVSSKTRRGNNLSNVINVPH